MTLKKKIFIGLGVFFIILLMAAVLAPFFININSFKPKIEKTLGQYLNAKVEIGSLEISIIQGVSAGIQGVKISNPPGFPEAPFLEIEHARIYVGALRSLFGNPRIIVTLTKPKIQIYENNQKELSITKLLKAQPPKPPSSPQSSKEETPPRETSVRDQLPKGMLGGLIIRSSAFLEIEDGELTYFQADGTTPKLQNIDLGLGPVAISDPIHLKLKAALSPLTKNNVTFQGPLELNVKLSNPLFSKEKISLELRSQLDSFQIITPWFKKEVGQKLNLQITGTVSDLKNLKFDTEERLFYNPTLSLIASSKGTLIPFGIEEAKGEIHISEDKSKQLPSFIKLFLESKKIPLPKQGSLNGDIQFQMKDTKNIYLSSKNIELQYETILLKLGGQAKLEDTPFIDLHLSTNTFASEILKPYLVSLPVHFKGQVSLPALTVKGNPLDPSQLDIAGKLLTQEGTLELTPKLLKGKPWSLTGPMTFSTEASFEISQKKLLSLELSTHADLTNTTVQFEKQFSKPQNVKCILDLQAQLKNDTFSISKLTFIFHNFATVLQGTLSPFSSEERFCQFTLTTDPFSLSEWNQFFPTIQNKFKGEAEIKNLKFSFLTKSPKDFSVSGALNLNQVTGEIPEKLFETKKFQMQGPFLVNLKSDIEYTHKKIKKLDIEGDINLTETQVTLPEVFNKQSKVPLQLELKIQSKEDNLIIEKSKFTLKDLVFDLKGQATQLSQKPNYTLHLTTSSIPFQDFSEFLPKLKDKGLSGNARIEADFKGTLSESKEPVTLGFNVTSTEINYTPPATPESQKKESPEKTKKSDTPSTPENPLFKRLTVNGQLKVTKASYKTYKFWNMEAPLQYKNKHLKIDPFKFDLYDGKFKASTHIDFNKKDPLTQIETSLQGFNLEKFFTSQKSKLSEKLTGTLEANLKLSLSGLKGEKIKRTISGNGKAMVKKGYFKVFNLSEALAGIPVLSKVAPGFNISDDFDFLQSTLIIKDQKLITPDILLKGQNHLLKCQGRFGFAQAMDGTLDYRGSYYLSRTEDLRKQIPFTVKGTVSKPQASVDAGRLLQ
ncbi:MAG: AsmA family protein, partial [Deltaproteobacteria bacterium]|nr:AsmA family protein [Deltaproteobacteria bacterium]